jgi:lysophospholipase L1-like esterase
VVFRLAAVLVGLLPFLLAEAAFTILDWGRPDYSEDPFVGFRAVRPLFVLSDDARRYKIAPSRLDYFRPESFARRKAPGEFRVFCLGGSTVQGRPFGIETSFTTWLEISLQAADPTRKWEVVNCGGISYASYRLVPILEEVLGYEPDLVIVYTGHNEFLEDRTYRHVKHMPGIVAWPCELLLRTRTYALLRKGYERLTGRQSEQAAEGRPILKAEVDAILDYQGGLEQYHHDQSWRRDVVAHFRYNLRRMVEMARGRGVPLVLMNPVSNLRDWPPFKSEHREGLTPDELKRWEALLAKGLEYEKTNMYQASRVLEKATAIDPQYAETHYRLAKCYDAMGMIDKAARSYLMAKEFDVCPLRALEPIHQAVLDVARETRTPLVDVRGLYEKLNKERTGVSIPGNYLLVDHVHPSIEGHQLIAEAVVEELAGQGIIRPRPGWEQVRDRKYKEHLASLGSLYYEKGKYRRARVLRWARGNADHALRRRRTSGDVGHKRAERK